MENIPAPLKFMVERKVRFEEVDSIGYVWHGHYPSYFEDARVALGEKYGLGYLDFKRENVIAPLKKMELDYIQPMRYGQSYWVEAQLHFNEATRLDFSYTIWDNDKQLVTKGSSVQLILDAEEKLLVFHPPFFREICDKWKRGDFDN